VKQPGLRYNIAWLALAGALLALAVWSRRPEGWLLAAAALGLAVGAVGWRERGLHRVASAVLGIAVLAAAVTELRLARLTHDWNAVVAAWEARLGSELDTRIRALQHRGARAAGTAAAHMDRGAWVDPGGLFSELASLRSRSGMAALAVFDAGGELEAWAGEHRGLLPEAVRLGAAPVVFVEGPLFSYLYFSHPIAATGGHATAAALLETGAVLPAQQRVGLAESFTDQYGSRPHFLAPASEPAPWRLTVAGIPVLDARFEPPSQAGMRAQVSQRGRVLVALAALAALLLLASGWVGRYRAARWAGALPLVLTAATLVVLPLALLTGLDRLFSPAFFLLPGFDAITLGVLLAALLPVGALAATYRAPVAGRTRWWVTLGAGAAFVGFGYPAVLRVLLVGASPALLEHAGYLWAALNLVAVLLLAIPTALLLPQGAGGMTRVRRLLLAAGVGGAALLAAFVATPGGVLAAEGPWMAGLWAVPFAAAAIGLAPYAGRGSRLGRWLLAGWLAATAVLPQLWLANTHSRLGAVERELATLGIRVDPFLDYLLRQFGDEIVRRDAEGEDGLALLYRSWVASGLAREGYPLAVTLWSDQGVPLLELPLGGISAEERIYPEEMIGWAHEHRLALAEPAQGYRGANHILAAPLRDGRAVSAVAPPRRTLEATPILAPLLGADPRPTPRLTLIPVQPGRRLPEGQIIWLETADGWQSEALVRYPEGEYHAHVNVRAAPTGVRYARGLLLLTLALLALTTIWLAGRLAAAEPPAPPDGWRPWLRSFRARVTVALFAFFLLPTVVFGWVAYGALAGEVARAARIVGERAVAQATAAFPEVENDLRMVAALTGEEVLYYQGGELLGASSPEAMELGLYNAWMPPSIHLAFRTGEVLGQVETRQLGAASYLVAYRRLPPAGILAVPVSLVAGEASVRQRELADLVLFGILVGALLSLALSLAVGRELAGPIGLLRRAAAAVGAGRLGVRLPEGRADEFGQLYASFNRMARRLRRARARERRSARVLAWGEMARQVAHEIKNPLTPIKLSVQHIRRAHADRRPEFDEILEQNVDQILIEIERLTEIAQAFSRFGAPPEAAGPLEAVAVERIAAEALSLYRAGGEAVRYVLSAEADLPPARARTGELKEVLFNLLENARAAMDGSGAVHIEIGRTGEEIVLRVRDSGEGIEPDQLPRIFEPHFSTRSTGTGLGLAIVRRFVESWGGSVAADSEVGRGTEVVVRMRIADVTHPAAERRGGGGA
jgi:signal transduction histidine kinase